MSWYFKGDGEDDWIKYSSKDSAALEKSYQKKQKTYKVSDTYKVDFAKRIQYRIDDPDRWRAIKREGDDDQEDEDQDEEMSEEKESKKKKTKKAKAKKGGEDDEEEDEFEDDDQEMDKNEAEDEDYEEDGDEDEDGGKKKSKTKAKQKPKPAPASAAAAVTKSPLPTTTSASSSSAELSSLRSQLSSLQSSHDSNLSALTTARSSLSSLESQLATLRTQYETVNKELERTKQQWKKSEQEAVAAKKELEEMKKEHEELEQEFQETASKLAAIQAVLGVGVGAGGQGGGAGASLANKKSVQSAVPAPASASASAAAPAASSAGIKRRRVHESESDGNESDATEPVESEETVVPSKKPVTSHPPPVGSSPPTAAASSSSSSSSSSIPIPTTPFVGTLDRTLIPFSGSDVVMSVCSCEDSSRIVVGYKGGVIQIWNVVTYKMEKTLTTVKTTKTKTSSDEMNEEMDADDIKSSESGDIMCLLPLPRNRILAGQGRFVRIYSISAARSIASIDLGLASNCTVAHFLSDSRIAIGISGYKARVEVYADDENQWKTGTIRPQHTLSCSSSEVRGVSELVDGRIVIAGCSYELSDGKEGGSIELWNPKRSFRQFLSNDIRVPSSEGLRCNGICVTTDGRLCAAYEYCTSGQRRLCCYTFPPSTASSSSSDGFSHEKVQEIEKLNTPAVDENTFTSIKYLSGSTIVTSTWSGKLNKYNIDTGERVQIRAHEDTTNEECSRVGVAIVGSGATASWRVISIGGEGELKLWK